MCIDIEVLCTDLLEIFRPSLVAMAMSGLPACAQSPRPRRPPARRTAAAYQASHVTMCRWSTQATRRSASSWFGRSTPPPRGATESAPRRCSGRRKLARREACALGVHSVWLGQKEDAPEESEPPSPSSSPSSSLAVVFAAASAEREDPRSAAPPPGVLCPGHCCCFCCPRPSGVWVLSPVALGWGFCIKEGSLRPDWVLSRSFIWLFAGDSGPEPLGVV